MINYPSILDLVQLGLGRCRQNSESILMWRYGAAVFAASIRRHIGWVLSRMTANINSRGSALAGRQRGSSFIKPGVGKRPCFSGNGGCVGGYIGGSRVVGIGLALRREKGRRRGKDENLRRRPDARPLWGEEARSRDAQTPGVRASVPVLRPRRERPPVGPFPMLVENRPLWPLNLNAQGGAVHIISSADRMLLHPRPTA
jgi:hypothetical protein